MYSYLAMPSLICHWLLPYLLLHPPLTTFMSSFVHMSQLAPLSVLRAPLLTSVCSLVNLCVLPCWPLCAPLLTSVCSLVDLHVLPCWLRCAPLSVSVSFYLDCLPLHVLMQYKFVVCGVGECTCYVRVGALLWLCLVLCLCLIMCLCIVWHALCIHTPSHSKYLQLWRN